jgi:hypothetical protein
MNRIDDSVVIRTEQLTKAYPGLPYRRANCGSRSGARFSAEVGCRDRAGSDGSVPKAG